jgi:hypothetical protein
MTDRTTPAFYARPGTPAGDWWTLLHPPYTLWHLSYVVLGAAVAPGRDWGALGLSVLAFLLAVGVAAHALDELHGRPLGTALTDRTLWLAAALSLLAAVILGVIGVFFWAGPVNVPLAVAIPVGAVLVVGYNLELFGGRLHTDWSCALGWGGFPVVVGFVAQSPDHTWRTLGAAAAATAGAVGTSYAQRHLSTAARTLRRRTRAVEGTITALDGSVTTLDRDVLLRPLEAGLRALSWAIPILAVAVLLAG